MTTDRQTARLRARVVDLETLSAAAYQFAGAVGAPEAWLDTLRAATARRRLLRLDAGPPAEGGQRPPSDTWGLGGV